LSWLDNLGQRVVCLGHMMSQRAEARDPTERD